MRFPKGYNQREEDIGDALIAAAGGTFLRGLGARLI